MTDSVTTEPIRTYALAGGHNFRDVGGYATTDGRSVAWGRLFRSGTLAHLTDEDHTLLDALGIRLIFDLRSNRERTFYPTRWMEGTDIEFWSRDYDFSLADMQRVAEDQSPGDQAAQDLTNALYRQLPWEQAESYSPLMKRIAAGDMPLVFHCSAGKDRTGTFAAILLDLLGVDRETIAADYALSEEHYEALQTMFHRDSDIHDMGGQVDLERIAPLLRARSEYIELTFGEIEARHGSTAGYANEVLGVSDAEIEALRERLLVRQVAM